MVYVGFVFIAQDLQLSSNLTDKTLKAWIFSKWPDISFKVL